MNNLEIMTKVMQELNLKEAEINCSATTDSVYLNFADKFGKLKRARLSDHQAIAEFSKCECEVILDFDHYYKEFVTTVWLPIGESFTFNSPLDRKPERQIINNLKQQIKRYL